MCGTTETKATLEEIEDEARRAAKEAVESIVRGTTTMPASHRVYAFKAFEEAFAEEWKRLNHYGAPFL